MKSVFTQKLWLRAAHTTLCSAALLALAAGAASPSRVASSAQAQPLPHVDVSSVPRADPGSRLLPGWQHGAFMEIFVRSYQDSDGDGVGDLRGLIQRLDYLRDLGISGLWLMPVMPSEDRDHGYATTDYRDIEPAYGTLADFDELLVQAHARGMGVIIDYVINHSATQHPLFQQARSAPHNPYRNWYVWEDSAPKGWLIYGSNPWYSTPTGAYLGQFSATMPDFNFRHPEVLRHHQSNLQFWLNRGVDGFRFDAVTHLVENGSQAWQDQAESYAVMGQLRSTVKAYQQRTMVCEAVSQPVRWASDAVCGSAFAFGHQQDIVNAARGDTQAITAVANYFKTAPLTMATMVSNHDLFAGERLWDQVRGDEAQYRLAAASYLLQPGTPFVYYGEEVGMSAAAGLSGDPKLRVPMSWSGDASTAGFTQNRPYRVLAANVATQNVASQRSNPQSLLAYYQTLLRLRQTHPSLARGSYEAVFVRDRVLGFQREWESEKTLVLINYGTAETRLRTSDIGTSNKRLQALYPNQGGPDADGGLIVVPGQAVRVLQLLP